MWDILDQYFTGNLTPEQLYELAKSVKADLVRRFSEPAERK